MTDCFVEVLVIVTWCCAKSFSTLVNQCVHQVSINPSDVSTVWVKLDKHFRSLQQLTDMINKFFGVNFAMYIIDDVLYYSTNIHEVLILQQRSDWTTALGSIIYLGISCIVLYFAVDIVKQVEALQDFLRTANTTASLSLPLASADKYYAWTNQIRGIPVEQYILYTNDLVRNSVALKAANTFPLTGSLVVTVKI